MKTFLIATACLVAALGCIAAYLYWHTVTLEYARVFSFKAVEVDSNHSKVVHISGLSGHSAFSVKKIETITEGSSIVVLVQIFLARRGTTGSFELDVPVPDSVQEIRFGRRRVVVWKRAQPVPLQLINTRSLRLSLLQRESPLTAGRGRRDGGETYVSWT